MSGPAAVEHPHAATAAGARAHRGDRVEALHLHGVVRLELVDPPPGFSARLRSQIASLAPDDGGAPDVSIHFVDQVAAGSPLRAIGLDEAWFGDDAFLLGLRGERGRAQIPLDRVGGRCEIACERSLPRVPLLRSILMLTALAKGHAPAHASAVEHDGHGIVTTGWTSGGKTGVQLSLMALGARFVSDDVVLIDRSGGLLGVHEPISVKDYYLDEAAPLRARVDPAALRRLRRARSLERLAAALPPAWVRRVVSGRTRRRLARWSTARRTLETSPQQLFGAERCIDRARLSHVLIAESADAPDVALEPTPAREAALRMAVSSRDELGALDAAYRRFRFAFPDRRNPILEQAETRLEELLLAAVDGAVALRVRHPYPASIHALTAALAPLCGGGEPAP